MSVVAGTIYMFCPWTVAAGANYTTLYSFRGVRFGEGSCPLGGLSRGTGAYANALFGATVEGGSLGYGSIFLFWLNNNTLVTTYSFDYVNASYPTALVQGRTPNNFFGVTQSTSNSAFFPAQSLATLFRVSATGTFQILYRFNVTECIYPTGIDYDTETSATKPYGIIYGNCAGGGTNSIGSVWKMLVIPDN